MKTIDFVRVLKKIIREEVRKAVRDEIQVLSESMKPTYNKQQTKSPVRPMRTEPLVTLDEEFRPVGIRQAPQIQSTGNNMLDQLLNETANNMTNPPEEFDPELAVSSAQTYSFVKDYSSILKKAEQIASNR
jgi:hypothetical protein